MSVPGGVHSAIVYRQQAKVESFILFSLGVFRSKALNGRSKALNAHSKALNGHSKALNGQLKPWSGKTSSVRANLSIGGLY